MTTTSSITAAACTTNPHDDGYDLVHGTDITGPRIGRIGLDDGGLVLRFDGDDETYLPDTRAEVAALLAGAGYMLHPESLADIDGLLGAS